ncbi:NADH-quinone oxidoreductase subunit NuoN [Parasulfuritortus cantonensis]|uniref:NADH-quinone oxidoreductase subunit N n=1 Tax=Parasulfuritortus cantonensis TaxID=2528202 RepID=A0A4R1BFB9_9PROT|nr:NADH-quinone oxidoreductase subunit NuoN [Parasulfuritortus cantonensis]TCJ15807.1 NADH-quinone oxidoreductase subunit NuoN [Parasulfuritortus cantonensis]
MIPPSTDFLIALPEISLLVVASVVLLIEAYGGSKNAAYITTLLGLLLGCVVVAFAGSPETRLAFGGLYINDAMGATLKVLTCFSAIMAVIYSRQYLADRGMLGGDYLALLLFAVLGMMVMISAAHFLTLYLGLELLSLALYAMVAMRRDDVRASEAAMKYFVLGALASGLLLYGMSLLYGLTGSLELGRIAEVVHGGVKSEKVLVFALVFVVAGLGFKLGAAPFHMWIPDVYHGAPTAVALFVGSAPKLAAFAFAMRLLADGLQPAHGDWQQMLAVMAVASLAIGNLAAIMQTNIKRMLAYSTISHMGFVLLGIMNGSLAGYSGAMFYAVTYVLMSLGGFGMVAYLSRAGVEAEELDDYKGLNAKHPWLAAVMGMFMLSMAGLPPFVGFYAKLTVLQALIGAGWIWLAVVAVMFSLIGAFYYLRVVKLMYFDAPAATDTIPASHAGDAHMLLSANGLAILLLGILPQPLMTLCAYSVQMSLG